MSHGSGRESVCNYFHKEGTEVSRPCGRVDWGHIFVYGVRVGEELYLAVEGIVVMLLSSFCWVDEDLLVLDVEGE